jgi:hypothetical protein
MRVWILTQINTVDADERYGVFSTPAEALREEHSGWLSTLARMADDGLRFGVDETGLVWFESRGGDRIEMAPEPVYGGGFSEVIGNYPDRLFVRAATSFLHAVLANLSSRSGGAIASVPPETILTGRWRLVRDDGDDA